MKSKNYIKEDEFLNMTIHKARRKGFTYNENLRYKFMYTSLGIFKHLSRKDKKKRYGKRGRRKSLAISLMEEKNHKTIKSITNMIIPQYKIFPLSILVESAKSNRI